VVAVVVVVVAVVAVGVAVGVRADLLAVRSVGAAGADEVARGGAGIRGAGEVLRARVGRGEWAAGRERIADVARHLHHKSEISCLMSCALMLTCARARRRLSFYARLTYAPGMSTCAEV
jgi:hypothetical protein